MTDEKQTGGLEPTWMVVELFGHQKIAGYARPVPMGATVMLRVDVPEVKVTQQSWGNEPATEVTIPGFTKFYGMGAVYAMTPVSEDVARRMMQSLQIEPVSKFDLRLPSLPSPTSGPDLYPDPDDEDEDETDDEDGREPF